MSTRRLAALLLGLVPAVTLAQQPEPAAAGPSGIAFDARLGLVAPLGDAMKGARLSDAVGAGIPLQLSLGYRFNESVSAALYGRLGAHLARHCPAGADCAGLSYALGVAGAWHFTPGSAWDVWAGAGIGLQRLAVLQSGAGDAISVLAGLQIPLQVGADYRLGSLTLGPYLELALGRFTRSATATGTTDEPSLAAIPGKAWHGWLSLGARLGYRL